MSPTLRSRLLLGLAFGFLVALGLALASDIVEVGRSLAGFTWAYLPIILGLTLFNYLLRFFKWHYYLGQIGVTNLRLGHSARLFVGGFPLAVTPGKVGEALKAVWLQRASGAPVARGLPVVIAERISDGLAVLILSTLGIIAYPHYWPAFAAVLGVLIGLIVVSQTRPLALWLLSMGERLPFVSGVAHPLREFYASSYTLFRPRNTLVAVSLGTVSWLSEGIGFYLVLVGLGLSAGWQTLSIAVFVLAFSTAVGGASTLPGGLGAAEASIAGMLLFTLSVSPNVAAAATLLIRFCTLWFGVSLGLGVWAVSRRQLFYPE